MSIRVKWEKNAEQWEALERALPGQGRGILRLAGMKLGLCEEERETCLKYLHTSHIHIVEYISSTQPSLALTSHDKMSFHMVQFKPILYNILSFPGVPPSSVTSVRSNSDVSIAYVLSLPSHVEANIHVICGRGRGMEYYGNTCTCKTIVE